MSGGGTQTTVTQAADPWYKGQALGLYNAGVDYLNATPYQSYQGQQVAGFQPMQLAAQDFLSRAFLGQSIPYQAPQLGGPYGATGITFPRSGRVGDDPSTDDSAVTPDGYRGDPTTDTGRQARPRVASMQAAPANLLAGLSPEQIEFQRTQTLMSGNALSGYPLDWRNQFPGPYPAGMPIWLDSWGPVPSNVYVGIPGGGYIERPYGDPTPINDPVPGGSPPDSTWPGMPAPYTPPVPPPQNPGGPQLPPPGGGPTPIVPPPNSPFPPGPLQPPQIPDVSGAGGGSGIGEAQQAAAIARMIAAGGGYPGVNPMMAAFERVSPSFANYRGDVFADRLSAPSIGTPAGVSPERVSVFGANAERVSPIGVNAREVSATGVNAREVSPTSVAAERVSPIGVNAREVSATGVGSRDVTTGDVVSGINRYRDPYEDQVVSQALQDIERARLLATNDARSQATLAGAFGGDRSQLLEAETNRGFADQAARTAAQLRSQGFERAAALAQQDAGRALQAGTANQSAALSAALANQASGLQAGGMNQDAALRAALANQGAGLQAGGMNQDALLRAALANQGAGLQAGGMNQAAALQAALANQGAGLQAGGMNQDALLRAALANQGAGLQAGGMNQDAALRAMLANQSAGLQAGTANQAAGLTAGLANQNTQRAVAEANARLGLDAGMANQSSALQAALANQARYGDMSQFNAGIGMQAGLANQGAGLQAALANQSAGLQGQLANQSAWFTGRNQQLQGAGLLGSLGGDIFNRTLGVGQAISALGAEQQGMAQDQIGANMAQFYEAQNDPYRRFGFLSGMLTGVPQGQVQTSYVPRNRGAGFAGGALSGAGAGSMFGPWGAVIGGLGGGLLGLL